MLLGESEGKFSYEEWNEACQMAEDACCGEEDDEEAEGEAMDVDGQVEGENLEKWLRSVVRRKVDYEQRWKSAT